MPNLVKSTEPWGHAEEGDPTYVWGSQKTFPERYFIWILTGRMDEERGWSITAETQNQRLGWEAARNNVEAEGGYSWIQLGQTGCSALRISQSCLRSLSNMPLSAFSVAWMMPWVSPYSCLAYICKRIHIECIYLKTH